MREHPFDGQHGYCVIEKLFSTTEFLGNFFKELLDIERNETMVEK